MSGNKSYTLTFFIFISIYIYNNIYTYINITTYIYTYNHKNN